MQAQSDNENEIDLGEESGPHELGESPATEAAEPQPKNYPTVMLSGGSNLMRIPDHGVSKIKHKVISKHLPSKYNKQHRIELELHSIKPHRMKKATSQSDFGNDQARIKDALMKG